MGEEDRSPCVQCDGMTRNKNECAESCEKLEVFQQRLPFFTLWRGDYSEYSIPGLQRTPCYRIYEWRKSKGFVKQLGLWSAGFAVVRFLNFSNNCSRFKLLILRTEHDLPYAICSSFIYERRAKMIDVGKRTFKTDPPAVVLYLRSWLCKKISMVKAISVALLGLILILFVRVIVLFFGKAGVPEIDLNDIERWRSLSALMDMENEYWDSCPYYAQDKCPHSSRIDRAYLIPHLIDLSETDEAKSICTKCGMYLNEKRKYIRLNKPFEVFVMGSDEETKSRGKIVNVSGVGALISFKDLPDFVLGQRVQIEIYSRLKNSEDLANIAVAATGEIKRIYDKDKQIAVMFIEEVQQELLLTI